MPHPESDAENQVMYMQDFILKRYILYKFTHDLQVQAPNYDAIMKLDYG
jgi:hypothetical protein